jgi:hypothetical protein
MKYQLAFSNTHSGLFHVTARAVGSPAPPVTAHYKNDEAFLRLIDRANLAPDEYARLVYAAMVAVTSPDQPECYEEVALDIQQLCALQLYGIQSHVA